MARDFNGTTQYLSGSAVLSGPPLTMACWFYSTSAAGNQTLISLGTAGQNNHRFTMLAAGNVASDPIQAVTRDTAASTASSSTGYSANAWQHACAVFAATNDRRAYVNGGSEGTETTSRTATGMNSTYLGVQQNATIGNYMIGRIAEAAVWNVALNASEIAALALGVSPLRIRPGNLVAYWPVFGEGSPEPDYVGGFHLTLNNAPTQADHAPVMPAFAFYQGWQGEFTAAAPGVTVGIPVISEGGYSPIFGGMVVR